MTVIKLIEKAQVVLELLYFLTKWFPKKLKALKLAWAEKACQQTS